MKRELDVTAYRMLTEYDRKGTLTSTIELRVPADELEYLGEVLAAQEDDEDVRCALVIRSKQDGAPRRLSLTLKNSKMKDFVPVAIFTKYGVASDNLTQLFDTGRYGQHELLLIVEVIEDREGAEPLDFEGEPQVPTWVLEELLRDDLARERMLDEGCPNCPDRVVEAVELEGVPAVTLAPVPPRVVLTPREPGEDLPFPIEETETDLVGLGLN